LIRFPFSGLFYLLNKTFHRFYRSAESNGYSGSDKRFLPPGHFLYYFCSSLHHRPYHRVTSRWNIITFLDSRANTIHSRHIAFYGVSRPTGSLANDRFVVRPSAPHALVQRDGVGQALGLGRDQVDGGLLRLLLRDKQL